MDNLNNLKAMTKKFLHLIALVATIFLAVFVADIVNAQTDPGEKQECSFCLYGQGCQPSSLTNTCSAGPPCSNIAGTCG